MQAGSKNNALQWYYLETEHEGGLRSFLKCRTFGLCMAHNRLLGFHVVRSTRPVVWTPGEFVPERSSRTPRTAFHIERYPDYPDPHFHLNHTGKYFFRNEALRDLRLEQYNRYWATVDEGASGGATLEDTCCDEGILPQADHKDYDEFSESVAEGQRFASSMKHVEGLRRRHQSRLAVSRVATIEPFCASREAFYQQRLLLGLSWFCDAPPTTRLAEDGHVLVDWTFVWRPPPASELGATLDPQVLVIGPDRAVSFEKRCAEIEKEFCRRQHNLICDCCLLQDTDKHKCKACRYCTGFHRCFNASLDTGKLRWRKGSLHGGDLDIERVMFNLHRKRLPLEVLRRKSDEYVEEGLLSPEKRRTMMSVIEQERNSVRTINEISDDEAPTQRETMSTRLSQAELVAELHRREELLKAGNSGVTDQWRVYTHIVNSLRLGSPLRLMVQASAGTGKSFLLTTVYLWCIVNGKKAKACAPTGIAAANVEIEG